MTRTRTDIQRLTAFTTDPEGGNPAGVALTAEGLDAAEMLNIAAAVGYSETAFITAVDRSTGKPHIDVRYFSLEHEVPFCGHATIATAVAWAQRHGAGDLVFETQAGPVAVATTQDAEGYQATLTSVPTSVAEVAEEDLSEALTALGWSRQELDPTLPPKVAFGGAHHLVLAAASRQRLAELDYDFERLKALMLARDWTTLQLVYREESNLYRARNPFPVGGVVEDPATGAAAAAFGGYLLERGEIGDGFTIVQGEDMGRRSVLHVEPATGDERRIRVSGHACRIED